MDIATVTTNSIKILIVSLIISLPLVYFILRHILKKHERQALTESMKGGFKNAEIEKIQEDGRFDGRSTGNAGGRIVSNREYRGTTGSLETSVKQQRRIPLSTNPIKSQDSRTDSNLKRDTEQDWPSFE